jgi:hypothetical protein
MAKTQVQLRKASFKFLNELFLKIYLQNIY